MRKYEIISSDSAQGLAIRVNIYLENGWDLVGGVAVDQVRNPYTAGDMFYQAVSYVPASIGMTTTGPK
jgi:hypothetical protein